MFGTSESGHATSFLHLNCKVGVSYFLKMYVDKMKRVCLAATNLNTITKNVSNELGNCIKCGNTQFYAGLLNNIERFTPNVMFIMHINCNQQLFLRSWLGLLASIGKM